VALYQVKGAYRVTPSYWENKTTWQTWSIRHGKFDLQVHELQQEVSDLRFFFDHCPQHDWQSWVENIPVIQTPPQ